MRDIAHIVRTLLRGAARRAEAVFNLVPLAILLLAALPAEAINVNPAVTNGVPRKRRPIGRDFQCDVCTEKTLATNGCVTFAVAFGRSPLVAQAPLGRVEIFELTAARLPSGADVLRYDHPLMRRIVDEDEHAGLVSVEEGSGWLVVYRDGVPVGWSSGADLAIRKDPATGLWVEQLENRTLVYYDADNTVDHIVTPAGVRLDWENAGLDVVWDGNAIGQVRSVADGLMDVTRLTPSSFRVSWYPPAAVGERENGRYAATGNPAKTFTFSYSNVGGEHRYALREYRDERFCFDYLWKSGDGLDWTFVKDPDGLAIADAESSTFAAGSTAAEGTRYETHVYSDAAGHTNRTILAYRYSANGATPVSRSAGSAPAHWSAARAETGPAAGRLVSVTNEYGGVTAKAYDACGRLLSETTTVFDSLEEMASYTYETNLVDGFPDRRPRHVIVTRDGVVVSDTAYSYGFALDGGRFDTVTRTDPVSGVSLVSSRLYYPVSSTNAAEAGRIRLSVSEDRTATLYAYAPTANGGYVRTATHGYIAEPDASAPGADASRFAIAPAQSTRTAETVNFRGDVVRVDEFVHTGDGWSPAGWTTYTYNLPHKRTGFADHKGDWEASEWICSGPVWQDLADGTAVTNTFDKAKRLATSTRYTPFGAVTTAYSYDPLGQIIGTTISTNGVAVRGTLAAYDARGRRILSVDEQGRTNTVAYSADSRTVTSTTQSGAVTTTTYNADGSVATVSGNVRPYELRSYGVDSTTGLAWTEVRTAQSETAPSVLSSRTFRNALSQTIRVENPTPSMGMIVCSHLYNQCGLPATIQFDVVSQDLSVINEGTPTINYVYDSLGHIISETRSSANQWVQLKTTQSYAIAPPDGSIWISNTKVLSCSDDDVSSLTNTISSKLYPLSVDESKLKVFRDQRGNDFRWVVRKDRAHAAIETSERTPWSRQESTSRFVAGRKVQSIDFSAVTNSYSLNAFGQVVSMLDGRELETRFDYDSYGRLIARRSPNGGVSSHQYDLAGNRILDVDELGNEIHYAFDAAGRKIARWGTTHPFVESYDLYGRRIAMGTCRDSADPIDGVACIGFLSPDSGFDVTRWSYDEATGVMTNVVYADGSEVGFRYDAFGRIIEKNLARGVRSVYQYDVFGELCSISYSDGTPSIELFYDGFGRIVSAVAAGVSTNGFSYNQFGEPIVEVQNGCVISRGFDEFGRTIGYQIDNGDQCGAAVEYRYDDCGRLVYIGIGTNEFSYSYLSGTHFPISMNASFGLKSNRVFSTNEDYVVRISNMFGDATVSEFEYEYDIGGRCTNRKTVGLAFGSETTTLYGYTNRSELTSEMSLHAGQTNWWACYEFDNAGNRLMKSCLSTNTSFTNNVLNQIFRSGDNSVVYDLDGNMIRNGCFEYGWDAENRLTSVVWNSDGTISTNRISFAYDYQGRIVRKTFNGITSSWLWDGGNAILKREGDDYTLSVWGLDIEGSLAACGGIGALLMQNGTRGLALPFYDVAGNVSEYVSSSGTILSHHEYDAFGNLLVSTGDDTNTSRPLFSTKSFDPIVGLSEFQFRFYSPELGRWLNRDPLLAMGIDNKKMKSSANNPFLFMAPDRDHRRIGSFFGSSSVFFGNYYEFCQNDPINQFDRFGLDDDKPNPPCCDDDSTPRNDEVWNSPEHVDSDNCYEYAMNRLGNPSDPRNNSSFKDPGDYSGKSNLDSITCEKVGKLAERDGLLPLNSIESGNCCQSGYHLVYLVVCPGSWPSADYHWYRKDKSDSNGKTYWSHKLGRQKVSDVDGKGEKIEDPSKANHNYRSHNYSEKCGYYCAPNGWSEKVEDGE